MQMSLLTFFGKYEVRLNIFKATENEDAWTVENLKNGMSENSIQTVRKLYNYEDKIYRIFLNITGAVAHILSCHVNGTGQHSKSKNF